MTPTQRTLARLREFGYHAAVVEKWNPHARVRQDLFGGIDIVAVERAPTCSFSAYDRYASGEGLGVLGIQACAAASAAARETKLRTLVAEPDGALRAWLAAGNRLEVWAWGLRLSGERRKDGLLDRRKTWQLDRRRTTLCDDGVASTERSRPDPSHGSP